MGGSSRPTAAVPAPRRCQGKQQQLAPSLGLPGVRSCRPVAVCSSARPAIAVVAAVRRRRQLAVSQPACRRKGCRYKTLEAQRRSKLLAGQGWRQRLRMACLHSCSAVCCSSGAPAAPSPPLRQQQAAPMVAQAPPQQVAAAVAAGARPARRAAEPAACARRRAACRQQWRRWARSSLRRWRSGCWRSCTATQLHCSRPLWLRCCQSWRPCAWSRPVRMQRHCQQHVVLAAPGVEAPAPTATAACLVPATAMRLHLWAWACSHRRAEASSSRALEGLMAAAQRAQGWARCLRWTCCWRPSGVP